MAARSKTLMFRGPWRGVELREPYQQDEHCEIAINVDFSNGYIESRKGFDKLNGSGTEQPRMARLHVHDNPDGRKYLLAVGLMDADDGNQYIGLYAVRLDGGFPAVDDVQELGSERGNYQSKVSFVDVYLPTDGTEPVKYVTLISTATNTYVFDPDTFTGTITEGVSTEKVDAATPGNALKINDANFSYWDTAPFGTITTWHQGRVYYAGFSRGATVELSSTLEATQNQVPESIIKGDRQSYTLGPNWFAFSDEFDPVAVQAHHIISTEEAETITGLKSFKEDLVIFTDKGIHIMTGATDDTFAIYKVVNDVGCVSSGSIVEAGGLLYFMAADGIYAFDGSQVVNISLPIQSLWSHDWDRVPFVNSTMRNFLKSHLYPWNIDRDSLELCNAMHYNDKHQIWFSVSLMGDSSHLFRLTIVWDYIHQAWSFYVRNYRANNSCMYDGVTFKSKPSSRQKVFVSTGRGNPSLMEYRGGVDENGSSPDLSIPMVWMSGRILKENDSVVTARPTRVKMLSLGKEPSSYKPIWFLESENASHSPGLASTGTLPTHPNESAGNFWGDKNWEDLTFEGPDWFTAKIEGAAKGRWFRVGFIDDGAGTGRKVLTKVQSISVEIQAGSTR